jgi:hypothetical protein
MTLICFLLVLCNVPAVIASEDTEIPASRPGEAGKPTTVEVGIYVVDIDSIDSVNQTFDANVFILLKWKDPGIPLSGEGIKKIPLNRIWNPNILIANESENVRKTFPETAEVNTDGSVLYRQRYIGTFSQPLRLHDFPFDRHTFSIQFVAQGFRIDEIRFIPYSEHFGTEIDDTAGIAKNISLPDWTIIDYKAAIASYEILPTLHIPGYEFQFTAERDSGHYIWKVILPLILIVGMSWIVFWIHPSQSGTQISLAVTSMLTLIAYRFTIDLLVPRVSYMTRMDKFILLATILVFLTLIQANLTGRLYAKNKITVAENIDKLCRIFFPVIFILVILLTLAL